jgi:hypothetical protein
VKAQLDNDPSLVISYLTLRKVIGVIGIALPFVLALGKVILQGPGIQESISSYYYTLMRDVFVGSLCAIAVFLMAYKGYERQDDIAGNIAGIAAICVALFPTTPAINPSTLAKIIGGIHLTSATIFFVTLAYFCLKLFTKSDQAKIRRQKRRRNQVYTTCGYIIVDCIILIGLHALLPPDNILNRLDPVFWLESLAIIAFGVAWFTKGEGILKDGAPQQSRAPQQS